MIYSNLELKLLATSILTASLLLGGCGGGGSSSEAESLSENATTDTDTVNNSDNTASDNTETSTTDTDSTSNTSGITTGVGSETVSSNLFTSGGRPSPLGIITDSNNQSWSVPADVNFLNDDFPTAADLYNPYNNQFNSTSAAASAYDSNDIIEIDENGEVVTAFIFADNYFELYINGVKVGKDPIPFTDFNSNIVKFKVERPFTVAMLLVDWEENLGTGTESKNGSYSPGDGGLVAVFNDASDTTIAITDSTWKAQTFYTAPITDLDCLTESGNQRLSTHCSTGFISNLATVYGKHWAIDADWMTESYDDSDWPSASTYTNDTVGVNNKPSYTNFTDVFDASGNDAQFIWSTNLVLDNEVLVRKVIE